MVIYIIYLEPGTVHTTVLLNPGPIGLRWSESAAIYHPHWLRGWGVLRVRC